MKQPFRVWSFVLLSFKVSFSLAHAGNTTDLCNQAASTVSTESKTVVRREVDSLLSHADPHQVYQSSERLVAFLSSPFETTATEARVQIATLLNEFNTHPQKTEFLITSLINRTRNHSEKEPLKILVHFLKTHAGEIEAAHTTIRAIQKLNTLPSIELVHQLEASYQEDPSQLGIYFVLTAIFRAETRLRGTNFFSEQDRSVLEALQRELSQNEDLVLQLDQWVDTFTRKDPNIAPYWFLNEIYRAIIVSARFSPRVLQCLENRFHIWRNTRGEQYTLVFTLSLLAHQRSPTSDIFRQYVLEAYASDRYSKDQQSQLAAEFEAEAHRLRNSIHDPLVQTRFRTKIEAQLQATLRSIDTQWDHFTLYGQIIPNTWPLHIQRTAHQIILNRKSPNQFKAYLTQLTHDVLSEALSTNNTNQKLIGLIATLRDVDTASIPETFIESVLRHRLEQRGFTHFTEIKEFNRSAFTAILTSGDVPLDTYFGGQRHGRLAHAVQFDFDTVTIPAADFRDFIRFIGSNPDHERFWLALFDNVSNSGQNRNSSNPFFIEDHLKKLFKMYSWRI